MSGFDKLKDYVLLKRSPMRDWLDVAMALGGPTILCLAIDHGAYGEPFLCYLPAVLMVSLINGWRLGLVVAVVSMAMVALLFPPPAVLGHPVGWLVLGWFAITAVMVLIIIGAFMRRAIIELDDRARQSESFNIELQHRTKNALQMMRALASRASHATDPAEFYDKLAGRLDALAKANELLHFGAMESCDVREVIGAALKPFEDSQIITRGPSCRLHKNAVTPLMMALHELSTNATKYGALSVEQGQVILSWECRDTVVAITWQECGGPEVSAPSRRGIGSRLLSANGGLSKVALSYDPGGLVCMLEALRVHD